MLQTLVRLLTTRKFLPVFSRACKERTDALHTSYRRIPFVLSPLPQSSLGSEMGGEAARGKTLGAEGAIVIEPHFQLCRSRPPPPFLLLFSPSFSSLSFSFPSSNPLNALTIEVFLRALAPRAWAGAVYFPALVVWRERAPSWLVHGCLGQILLSVSICGMGSIMG